MRFKVGEVAVELLEEGDRICMSVARGKPFEPETLVIWSRLCLEARQAGGLVVDVGAYSGLFSIAAALHGCNVIAFEPMPANLERLRANLKANKVAGEVVIAPAAASDRIGEGEITFNPKASGLTSGASLVRRKGPRLAIKLTTIDATCLAPLLVSAIKIDVERAEPQVLAGAQATIARCRPAILVEVLDEERAAAVRAALPDYRIAAELDVRNWLMLPL